MRRAGLMVSLAMVMAVSVSVVVAVHTIGHPPEKQVLLASQRAGAALGGTTVRASSARQVGASAASSAAQCSDVLFVGARGSGESGLGADVNQVYSRLKSALGNNLTIAPPVSVDYLAAGVGTILTNPAKYFDGLSDGVSATMTDLENQAAKCPDQQIVLAGFSQGAMVMHRVLHQLSDTQTDQLILSRVTAAVLIGDGDQVPGDNETRYGSALPIAFGIGQEFAVSGSSLAKFDSAMSGQVLRVCNRGDVVCDFGTVAAETGLGASLASDLGGPIAGRVIAAVIKGAIRIHLSYLGSKPLRQAIDQAASDLLKLRYTGGTLDISGTVGKSFSVTATVTGGVLPLFASGGIDGDVPPSWFGASSLSRRTVTLSGTPAAAGSWDFDIDVQDDAHHAITIPIMMRISPATPVPVPGGSWRAETLPQNTEFQGQGYLACPSATVCFIPGRTDTGTDGVMLSTTDAGATWNSYQLPAGTLDYGDYGDMACPSTTVCYAPGSIDSQTVPVVLATKDGGKTWVAQSLPSGLGSWVGPGSSITCPSPSVCYEADPVAPLMLSTTDGGATWAAVSLPSAGPAVTPTCASTVLCYAIDGNGVVKTTDGTTWNPLTSEPLPATQLVCPAASDCYVADNGPDRVAVTHDGGQTWSVQSISAGSASSLTCATATTCFLTGNQPGSAGFAKTTNGGQSWMPGQIPAGFTFDGAGGASSLICKAPNSCYAAVSQYPSGSGAFVIFTADDGATWTTSPLPNGDAPTAALVCPTATVCFAPDSFTTVLTNAPKVTPQSST